MKKLFIRFFNNKNDMIPADSYPVRDTNNRVGLIEDVEDCTPNLLTWMTRHPDGKVDFVWF